MTELRSIYSGPIRRSLEGLDGVTARLNDRVTALETALVAAQADLTALRERVDVLEEAP